jgi:hypothetical protein
MDLFCSIVATDERGVHHFDSKYQSIDWGIHLFHLT